MRILVSVFDLKATTSTASFKIAWQHFGAALAAVSPATELSPVCARVSGSGYDTDATRRQSFMTTIAFPDAAEADRVWSVIEDSASPLNTAHVAMLRLTRDQLFSFWAGD